MPAAGHSRSGLFAHAQKRFAARPWDRRRPPAPAQFVTGASALRRQTDGTPTPRQNGLLHAVRICSRRIFVQTTRACAPGGRPRGGGITYRAEPSEDSVQQIRRLYTRPTIRPNASAVFAKMIRGEHQPFAPRRESASPAACTCATQPCAVTAMCLWLANRLAR
jgi:hypothetical protein